MLPISVNHRCTHFQILRSRNLDVVRYTSNVINPYNRFERDKKATPIKMIFLKPYMGKYRCSVCGHIFSVRQKEQLDKFTDYLIQTEPYKYNPVEIQKLGKGIGMVTYQKREGKIYEISMEEYAQPNPIQF